METAVRILPNRLLLRRCTSRVIPARWFAGVRDGGGGVPLRGCRPAPPYQATDLKAQICETSLPRPNRRPADELTRKGVTDRNATSSCHGLRGVG